MNVNIGLVDKTFVQKLIYSVIHIHDELVYVLARKLFESNFFRLDAVRNELPDEYLKLLEDVFRFKLIGKSSEEIKELIKSNPIFRDVYKEIEFKYEGNISYSEMEQTLKEFMKKVKSFMLLNFVYSTIPFINNTSLLRDDNAINELLEKISKLYDDLSIEYKTDEAVFDDKNADKFIDELIHDTDTKHKVIKTGIELLDLAFDELGLRTKELFVLSSAWGIGKTRFVSVLGSNFVKQGYVVYHITIENSLEDVLKLYATAFTNISFDYVKILAEKLKYVKDENTRQKLISYISAYKSAVKNVAQNKNLIIKKFPIDNCTPAMIDAYIKQALSRGLPKPDVIIVDHMDLLIPSRGDSGNLFLNGQEIAKELKGLAEKYNALVIAPSQLNVEGVRLLKKGYEVGGEAGSRSRAKFEIASYHISLNQSQSESANKIARLYIDKNRHGLSMLTIPIHFDKGKLIVYDIQSPNEIVERFQKAFENEKENKVKKLIDRILSSVRILKEKKDSIFEQDKLIPDEDLINDELNKAIADDIHDDDTIQESDISEYDEALDEEKDGDSKELEKVFSESENDTSDESNSNKDDDDVEGRYDVKLPSSIVESIVSLESLKPIYELGKKTIGLFRELYDEQKPKLKEFSQKHLRGVSDFTTRKLIYEIVFNDITHKDVEIVEITKRRIKLRIRGDEYSADWITANKEYLKADKETKALLMLVNMMLVNRIEFAGYKIHDTLSAPYPFIVNSIKGVVFIPYRKLDEQRILALSVRDDSIKKVILNVKYDTQPKSDENKQTHGNESREDINDMKAQMYDEIKRIAV